jgi:glyoxylase I family protein
MAGGTVDAAVHHVAVSVADMDRALAFYRDLLGFEVEWEREHYHGELLSRVVGMPGADARVVMLRGHGLRIELFRYYEPAGETALPRRQCDFGLTHFALTVRGIQDLYARLSAAGVAFNCPPQNLRPGVWVTYMKDPEGVTIELVEYA